MLVLFRTETKWMTKCFVRIGPRESVKKCFRQLTYDVSLFKLSHSTEKCSESNNNLVVDLKIFKLICSWKNTVYLARSKIQGMGL
jgi:hypothetical protein